MSKAEAAYEPKTMEQAVAEFLRNLLYPHEMVDIAERDAYAEDAARLIALVREWESTT